MSSSKAAAAQFAWWTRAVHEYVNTALGDVHARGNSMRVTFTRGSIGVEIVPDNDIWWVHFHRGGAFAMPSLYVSQHDGATARNVAKTIMGFFDATHSTPDAAAAHASSESRSSAEH